MGTYGELPFDSLDEILMDEMGVLPSCLDLLGQLVLVPNEARKRNTLVFKRDSSRVNDSFAVSLLTGDAIQVFLRTPEN